MASGLRSWLRYFLAVVTALSLLGCASTGGRAPVEDRSSGAGRPVGAGPAAATPQPGAAPSAGAQVNPATPVLTRPNAENAGKPGYYTVRPGDTMARIALDQGQTWRDIARWNGIENPNVIEVGQVLRVAPPGADATAVSQPVATGSRIESRPLEGRPAQAEPAATAAASSAPPAPAPAPTAGPSSAGPREGDEDVNWLWPASGPLLGGFDEARNVKGLAIGGKAGDPVVAAADGRVVYSGSGLRGYGNLVIVKHNNTYLTAYAHNQTLLVREDQAVRRGQKIAEMGSSDSDRVQLHFEIRRMGRPIDPARLLPPR